MIALVVSHGGRKVVDVRGTPSSFAVEIGVEVPVQDDDDDGGSYGGADGGGLPYSVGATDVAAAAGKRVSAHATALAAQTQAQVCAGCVRCCCCRGLADVY